MPILLVKPKILTSEQRKELKQAGYIIIETSNPADVQVLDEMTTCRKEIVLEAALQALDWGNDPTGRQAFGNLFRKKLMAKMNIPETK